MLDDHRRKAVAAVGYFSHRASLPSAALLGYPVILTKPLHCIGLPVIALVAGLLSSCHHPGHEGPVQGVPV
jgi:hypothetical protein